MWFGAGSLPYCRVTSMRDLVSIYLRIVTSQSFKFRHTAQSNRPHKTIRWRPTSWWRSGPIRLSPFPKTQRTSGYWKRNSAKTLVFGMSEIGFALRRPQKPGRLSRAATKQMIARLSWRLECSESSAFVSSFPELQQHFVTSLRMDALLLVPTRGL